MNKELLTNIVGYSATCFLTISLIPQLYHTIKSKKVGDISFIFLCLQLFTCGLFLAYGLLLNENPLIIANSCVGFQLIILFYLKVKYGKIQK